MKLAVLLGEITKMDGNAYVLGNTLWLEWRQLAAEMVQIQAGTKTTEEVRNSLRASQEVILEEVNNYLRQVWDLVDETEEKE